MTADTCGVTRVGGSGIEWVCIRPVHDKAYQRRKTDAHHHGYVTGTGAQPTPRTPGAIPRAAPADRHYYVRKWPNRGTS